MIERTASFASSTDGQVIGELPRIKWCAPTDQDPAFLFRISGFSGASTEEGDSLQRLSESPQALGLKGKLLKLLCLR